MSVQQISIFLENRPGRLVSVAQILGDANCSILALSVADTKDFGILRMLVDDVNKAAAVLKDAGVLCQISPVSAVELGSAPGSLAKVLSLFDKHGVNLEYMYAMAEPRSTHPVMIFRFDKPEVALGILKDAGVHVLTEAELLA